MTEDDLRELDIPLRPRRKLQADVKSLSANEPPAQIAPSARPDGESHAADAELRQLTVLFCDLVGSTALSAKLDPEDLREIIRAYQDACAEVVTRYEGFVAKFMGGGVLVYFGYPQSFENDAERAIHAEPGLVEAVSVLRGPNDDALAARIGIATGGVIVGDIVGEGVSREAAITGETPNLAARLQDAAPPGTVVIGEMAHMLAGALFETEALLLLTLKGFTDPMQAWTVARPQRSESRFQATHGARLTELVGQEEKMAVLRRRWDQAVSGDGRVVLISGEPGIGKSRLVHEIRADVSAAGGYTRAWQCSPNHAASALFPFVEQAAIAINLTPRDSHEEMLDKLEAWIRISGQAPEDIAPIFAPFLSIDATMRYRRRTAVCRGVDDGHHRIGRDVGR